MNRTKTFTLALVGNPNAGKSSVFNQLTGLRQKVGNFPGVTVDKKIGITSLPDGSEITIVDLPGTYSLYPNSQDERIVLNILSNPSDKNYPDAIIYVADLTNPVDQFAKQKQPLSTKKSSIQKFLSIF